MLKWNLCGCPQHFILLIALLQLLLTEIRYVILLVMRLKFKWLRHISHIFKVKSKKWAWEVLLIFFIHEVLTLPSNKNRIHPYHIFEIFLVVKPLVNFNSRKILYYLCDDCTVLQEYVNKDFCLMPPFSLEILDCL